MYLEELESGDVFIDTNIFLYNPSSSLKINKCFSVCQF